MCNAAGKFFAQSCWISKAEQEFRAEEKVFESLGEPGDARFTVGLLPPVESPAATRRALCLLH